ncbi:MAG: hypothetical protein K2J01_05530 [Clostridiales bacterium]|nr:hypothetical protein [Clostridiales bacterium]
MDEKIKQSFKMMIAYQKKDIELRKLNNLIDRDEALAVMNKYKHAFNEAKRAIAECEQQAGVLLDMFAELQKYIEDNESVLAELENSDSGDSEEELERRVKRLESLKSKFQSADKKMHDIQDKARAVCNRRAEALKTGKAAQQRFVEAREKHGKLVSSKADELNKLKAELEEMRKSLDPKLFAEYAKLVDENKFPPIVRGVGDDKKNMFNCGGCGLNLSQKGNASLNDQGWFRCENCHRIIVLLD